MNPVTRYLLMLAAIWAVAGSAFAIDGLPHQSEPFDDIVVAGQPSLAQIRALAEEGFTTVINLRRRGEFDEFDEAAEVEKLGMAYVHIPVKNVKSIEASDADALHQALEAASGPVLLHCTIGWRAGSLLAIERYLLHGASAEEARQIASNAHMGHAGDDVEDWIEDYR